MGGTFVVRPQTHSTIVKYSELVTVIQNKRTSSLSKAKLSTLSPTVFFSSVRGIFLGNAFEALGNSEMVLVFFQDFFEIAKDFPSLIRTPPLKHLKIKARNSSH